MGTLCFVAAKTGDESDNGAYDKSSVNSIYDFALKLTGHTLEDVAKLPVDVVNIKNKGDLGRLVEKYYFKHNPPNNHEPDFAEASLELKVTGVVKGKNGGYRAKERLVLTNIDYPALEKETWENNYFRRKCEKMLIMFYLYDKNVSVVKQKFVLKPKLFEFLSTHEADIRKDWEIIRDKVREQKAHELSEGDTFILKACRKGTGGEDEKGRKQTQTSELAKSRAFSLRQGFMSELIRNHEADSGTILISEKDTIEEATEKRIKAYIGKSVEQISDEFNFRKTSKNQKGFHSALAARMLTGGKKTVLEFDLAGIEVKTIRLGKNGRVRESMSFPGFGFKSILHEDWVDSKFAVKLDQKFLFIIFKTDGNGKEIFISAKYWNMPFEDRQLARKVWEHTKERCAVDCRGFLKISQTSVAHVRPKARNSKDVSLTNQNELLTKQGFWLNASYINQVLEKLLR